MNEFDTNWDPFDHMVRLTNTVNELAAAHNRLAHMVQQQQKALELCQQQITSMSGPRSSTTDHPDHTGKV